MLIVLHPTMTVTPLQHTMVDWQRAAAEVTCVMFCARSRNCVNWFHCQQQAVFSVQSYTVYEHGLYPTTHRCPNSMIQWLDWLCAVASEWAPVGCSIYLQATVKLTSSDGGPLFNCQKTIFYFLRIVLTEWYWFLHVDVSVMQQNSDVL